MGRARVLIPKGQRFGYLEVLGAGVDGRRSDGSLEPTCVCRCVCGKEVTVPSRQLKRGSTKSCGCMKASILHAARTKHGSSRTPLYRAWTRMKDRCNCATNTAYKDYGGRGISVCSAWSDYKDFETWALSHGYAPHLTLDRIDVNGNYCPENCRWVDWKVQANNKRCNHRITIDGATHTLQEWADISGNSFALILWRLNAGKDAKSAIFDPPETRGSTVKGVKGKMYTAFGRTMNISQWSKALRITRTTLGARLAKGQTLEYIASCNSPRESPIKGILKAEKIKD